MDFVESADWMEGIHVTATSVCTDVSDAASLIDLSLIAGVRDDGTFVLTSCERAPQKKGKEPFEHLITDDGVYRYQRTLFLRNGVMPRIDHTTLFFFRVRRNEIALLGTNPRDAIAAFALNPHPLIGTKTP